MGTFREVLNQEGVNKNQRTPKNFRSFCGIIYIDNKIFLAPKVAASRGTATFFVALNLKIYGGVHTGNVQRVYNNQTSIKVVGY